MKSGRTSRARLHSTGGPNANGRSRKTWLRLLAVALAAVVVMGVGGYVYATSWLDGLPQVTSLDSANHDTLVYDRNGILLADVGNGGDHRVSVSYNQISPAMINATVATEDRTFWTNSGFDSQGIARSVIGNFQHKAIVGGGSTITQQLAKQLFLGSEVSYSRKIKEVLLAYQVTQKFSKKDILTAYLNENNYGEQQYGVQSASRAYFNKDAKDLDVAQASLLAGLPQAPYDYDPIKHPAAAKARQLQVLDSMVAAGYIKPAQEAAAYAEQLQIAAPVDTYKASQFVRDQVLPELEALGFKPGQQQMVVRTTLDYGKQQLAEGIVHDNWQKNLKADPKGALSASMVAMDPNSGQILAYVGSPGDGPKAQEDYAGVNYVSPGSSVKPYTYSLAIANGQITMDTPIYDGPTPFVVQIPGAPPYKVTNYLTGKAYGMQPARIALASSLNISAVKVELAVGVPNDVEWFRKFGMKPHIGTRTDNPATDFGPSFTLGTGEITMLEHATGLSVFANGQGVYHPPEALLAVTDAKGGNLYAADPNRGIRKVVDAGVAFIISSMISDDNNRAPVFGRGTPLHLNDRHASAKTGTGVDFVDGLTVGWTPDLVSVFWVGDTVGQNLVQGSDGVYVAAPAWHEFMEAALKGVPDKWYQPPGDVTKGPGNSWYLTNTGKPDSLAGDKGPAPSPSPGDFGVPPDPGTGPVPIGPTPRPRPTH